MTKDWYLDNLDKMLGYVHTLEDMVHSYQMTAKKDEFVAIQSSGKKIETVLNDLEDIILGAVNVLDFHKDWMVESSRKPIKSSIEDRLIPYLEEFEEGYSSAMVDDPMDDYAGVDTTQFRLETFYETFKNDHNLSDDDINNLENAVLDIWNETDAESGEIRDMGEMYGNHYGDAEYFK